MSMPFCIYNQVYYGDSSTSCPSISYMSTHSVHFLHASMTSLFFSYYVFIFSLASTPTSRGSYCSTTTCTTFSIFIVNPRFSILVFLSHFLLLLSFNIFHPQTFWLHSIFSHSPFTIQIS